MLLFTLNLGAGAAPAAAAAGGYYNKKRHFANIGGVRMLFSSQAERDWAVSADSPQEAVAAVIKQAAVKPKPVVQIQAAPEYDDEDDIEFLLMAA